MRKSYVTPPGSAVSQENVNEVAAATSGSGARSKALIPSEKTPGSVTPFGGSGDGQTI